MMKNSLSKVALAMACMTSSIAVNFEDNGVFFDEEESFISSTAALLSGVRWTTTRANAFGCTSNDVSQCGENNGMPRYVTFGSAIPNQHWDWSFDPFIEYDYRAADAIGGSSGASLANDGEITQDPILTPHEQQDLANLVAAVKSHLIQLKASLAGLPPDQLAKLDTIIDGLGKWSSMLTSGFQLSEHLINQNWDASFAEAAAFLAGLGMAAGTTAALGASTPPAVAGMVASFAAFGAATITEALLNEVGVVTWIDKQFDTEILFFDLDRWQAEWDSFRCAVGGVCRHIPPIILDMNGDGFEMAEIGTSKTFMDYDNDGFEENISWVTGDDAILFVDHNRSGTLDDYYEFSLASLAGKHKTDLDGLRTLDLNGDDVFDEYDDAYAYTGIWLDLNRNAKADTGETMSLTEAGIRSLNLAKNGEFISTGGSSVMDTMTFTLAEDDGSLSIRSAYNVMVIARVHGQRVEKLDDGTKILIKEIGAKALNMKMHGSDTVFNVGVDSVKGYTDFNAVQTGPGNDRITVSQNESTYIKSGDGNDELFGGISHDVLLGQKGDDTIYGFEGSDRLKGGKGKDVLFGGDDNDILYGAQGDDALDGEAGDDLLVGGPGSDIFTVGLGHDRIRDFKTGKDKIRVVGYSLSAEQLLTLAEKSDKDVFIKLDENNSVTLKKVKLKKLTTSDFITN